MKRALARSAPFVSPAAITEGYAEAGLRTHGQEATACAIEPFERPSFPETEASSGCAVDAGLTGSAARGQRTKPIYRCGGSAGMAM